MNKSIIQLMMRSVYTCDILLTFSCLLRVLYTHIQCIYSQLHILHAQFVMCTYTHVHKVHLNKRCISCTPVHVCIHKSDKWVESEPIRLVRTQRLHAYLVILDEACTLKARSCCFRLCHVQSCVGQHNSLCFGICQYPTILQRQAVILFAGRLCTYVRTRTSRSCLPAENLHVYVHVHESVHDKSRLRQCESVQCVLLSLSFYCCCADGQNEG